MKNAQPDPLTIDNTNQAIAIKAAVDKLTSFSDLIVITTVNLGAEPEDIYKLYQSLQEKRVKVSQ